MGGVFTNSGAPAAKPPMNPAYDWLFTIHTGKAGGLSGRLVVLAGGLSTKSKEANVMLTLVNSRTTEQERMTEGYFRKKDLAWAAGGGGGWGGGFGGVGGGSYANTEIGQVITLAYLDAYKQLVTQLGGLPEDPSAAAPVAQ